MGTTSSHHGPYGLGYTRPTMGGTEGCQVARRSQSLKAIPSSDSRLQFACLKPESLVIAGQHTAVNVFLSLVHTARQATRIGRTRSHSSNRKGGRAEGEAGKGD